MTARENSSKLSTPSWFVSSWSKTRRAELSGVAAPLGVSAVAELVVDEPSVVVVALVPVVGADVVPVVSLPVVDVVAVALDDGDAAPTSAASAMLAPRPKAQTSSPDSDRLNAFVIVFSSLRGAARRKRSGRWCATACKEFARRNVLTSWGPMPGRG